MDCWETNWKMLFLLLMVPQALFFDVYWVQGIAIESVAGTYRDWARRRGTRRNHHKNSCNHNTSSNMRGSCESSRHNFGEFCAKMWWKWELSAYSVQWFYRILLVCWYYVRKGNAGHSQGTRRGDASLQRCRELLNTFMYHKLWGTFYFISLWKAERKNSGNRNETWFVRASMYRRWVLWEKTMSWFYWKMLVC